MPIPSGLHEGQSLLIASTKDDDPVSIPEPQHRNSRWKEEGTSALVANSAPPAETINPVFKMSAEHEVLGKLLLLRP